MKTLMMIPIWLFTLSAHALTNSLALLPPMGWNTWYCFVDVYDDAMIRGVTDAMVTNGLQAAGYQYINLDGCYWFGRDTNGNMLVDTNRFPSGISGLAAYVRAKGFKFGI